MDNNLFSQTVRAFLSSIPVNLLGEGLRASGSEPVLPLENLRIICGAILQDRR